MKNIACLVEYSGENYFGFQRQNSTIKTIQYHLEDSLSRFAKEPISIIVAGRTDTGVHATHQVINFKTNVERGSNNWIRGANSFLPPDICLKDILEVDVDFNARFDAIDRTYQYYLYNDPVRPAILNQKVGWYFQPLDIETMQLASKCLIGNNDFSSFRATGCQANNPIRDMKEVKIYQYTSKIICFEFRANSFLYHMIRNIVGALVYVGKGNISVKQFEELLLNKDRTKSPPTFMADGLYLTNINYKNKIFNLRIIKQHDIIKL
jgi:tRNA pseudouridine38-40 synthase